MKSFNQFILEKKNPKKDSSGPLSSDEKKNIKANKEKVTRLTISGEEESKKIKDELTKSDTKGDTPTNKKNRKRRGRTSLYGDIPKDKRNVQPDANKTADKRIKDAKNTRPPDIFSKKKVSGRKNIVDPGVVRDPKTGETLTYGKGSPSPKTPSQSSNTYFSDLDDSTAKKYPKTDDSKFTSENKPEPKKPKSKVLERPTKKPSTKRPSTSSLPSESKPKPSRKYTRAQKARLTGQADKILKQIKSAKKLETRMTKAIDKSTKPGTYSDKVNRVIKSKPLKGTPKPEVIKQAEVSDQIKNNQETRRSRKLRNVGKPTPTTVSTSNNYKRNPNPNPTPRKTDQQVMRDLEARSSSSNRKQGYSIKNDLEAIKRKRNISSNTSSSSSSFNNKPPEIETPLTDNQKKSFKKFKSRIDSIGIDPSIEKTKTKFDNILDSSKKKEFFDKTKYNNQNQQNNKGDGKKDKNNKNNKNKNKNKNRKVVINDVGNDPNNPMGLPDKKKNKKTTWQKLRKNLFGKSKKYKGDAVSNLLYPGFTGVSAYMRERGKGSGQTRSTAVGVGRGYLDYKAARLAGQTAFKVTPGPAWLKGASATVASGLALVGSSKLGRNIEDNLPLNKAQQAQVDAAKDKEEKKKQIKRQNQLRSIITPPRASLPNVPKTAVPYDFGYGFNTKGSGKSR